MTWLAAKMAKDRMNQTTSRISARVEREINKIHGMASPLAA